MKDFCDNRRDMTMQPLTTDLSKQFPLRYVVLHHTGIDSPHFDFMMETEPGSRLATWRTVNWPAMPDQAFEPLDLHRREYLEYQGPVSGNRGQVKRIAAGDCGVIQLSPTMWTIELRQGITLNLPVNRK